MAEWITVKEAAELLKISRRQVINKVNTGQLKAKRQGRLWLIHESLSDDTEEIKGTSQEVPKDSQDFSKEINLKEMVEFLKKQLEEKDQQINQQQAIIMQLSRNQQLMLESGEKKKARQSWWKRFILKNNT